MWNWALSWRNSSFCAVLKGRVLGYRGPHPKLFQAGGHCVLTGPNLPTSLAKWPSLFFQSRKQLWKLHWSPVSISRSFSEQFRFWPRRICFGFRITQSICFWISILERLKRNVKMRWKAWWKRKAWWEYYSKLLEILWINCSIHLCQLITDPSYVNLHKESEKDRMGLVYELVLNCFTNRITLKDRSDLCNLFESFQPAIFKKVVLTVVFSFLKSGSDPSSLQIAQEEKSWTSVNCFWMWIFYPFNSIASFKEKDESNSFRIPRKFGEY